MDKQVKFEELCNQNGLDPNDTQFGSKTLLAWYWFNLGYDESVKDNTPKCVSCGGDVSFHICNDCA
jgi:hypothetical protein